MEFTPPPTPTLVDAAGNAVAAATVTAANKIAPLIEWAETTSTSTVMVTFREPVAGTTSTNDWTVGGSPPALLRANGIESTEIELSEATTLTLVTATRMEPDSGTTVTYTPPGTAGLADTVPPSAPPHETANPMPAHQRYAYDRTAPTPTAAFANARTITLTFDEALQNPGSIAGLAYTVTVPDGDDADGDPDTVSISSSLYDERSRTLALTLAADAAPGVMHTVLLPASALADSQHNVVSLPVPPIARPVPANDAAPTFTARTLDTELVEVNFDMPVSGAVSASQWSVDGSAAASLHAARGSETEAASLSGATSLYLVTGTLEPGAAPKVAFAPPEAPTLASAAGHAVAAATVTATDRIPPTIALVEKRSPTVVVVSLSETLRGTTSAGDWRIDGSAPASLRAGLGTQRVATDASTLLRGMDALVLTAEAALAQGSMPTVKYAPAASPIRLLADAAGNALEPATVRPPAPAAFTARTVNATLIEVTFASPVTGAVSASQWTVAGAVASSLLETRASTSPATSLSGATALYIVTFAMEPDSRPLVAFTPPAAPTLADAAGNTVAAATVMAADAIAPAITGATATSKVVVYITFSEDVAGMTAASEWTVDGVSPASLLARHPWEREVRGVSYVDGTVPGFLSGRYGQPPSATASASGAIALGLYMPRPLAPDSTPTVVYSPAMGAAGLADTVTHEAPSHETATPMRSQSLVASDGIDPSLDASAPPSFTGTSLVVTFDEEIVVPSGTTLTATHEDSSTVSAVPTASGRALTFPLGDSPAGGTWTLAIPPTITDTAGNALDESARTPNAAYSASDSFTARTLSLTSTSVTLGAPASGTLDVSHWSVTDALHRQPTRYDDRKISAIALGSADNAPRATAGAPYAIPASSSETTLVITHTGLRSDASTPAVSYAKPASGGLGSGDAPLPSHSTVAIDGIPPSFTAVTETLTTTRVHIGEIVSLSDNGVADWNVDGAPPTSVTIVPFQNAHNKWSSTTIDQIRQMMRCFYTRAKASNHIYR